ncbi:hydroxyneurosporene methyltransferase [Gigaspora margarita]|uniref:Hydroxyneurosporene methyltransferase n=1 Tax=Gigaspora margarita TaxID=4874 RepID=A0A8H4B0D5_GIGMA|nr:hydroxyneurosporene methyltransferase [Gigaspora margarita]
MVSYLKTVFSYLKNYSFYWLAKGFKPYAVNNQSYKFSDRKLNNPFVNKIFLWIGKKTTDFQRRVFPPSYLVLNEWCGFLVSKIIYELTKLEVADIIKAQGGKMNIYEIAKATGTKEDKLNRLLRVAASKGIFCSIGNGVYANTQLSLVLCKDHPNTFRNIILLYEEYSSATQYLAYDLKLQTGNKNERMTPFAKAHDGIGAFEWWALPENKERQEVFNKGMIEQDSIYGKGLHQDYDWSQYRNATYVDVAGGSGGFLFQLLTRYPTMKGVLYEYPSVIEKFEQLWSTNHKELLDRVQFFRGDFFINPPPPSDVYFLRSILHNWPDEQAVKILKTIHSAIPSTNVSSSYHEVPSYSKPKLLIAEILIDDRTKFPLLYQLDILMMCMYNGKERTKSEITELLNKSGWKLTKVTYCRGGFSVIEAVPL